MLYVIVIGGYIFASQTLTYTIGPFQSERSADAWLQSWKVKQPADSIKNLTYSLVKVQDPFSF